MIIVEKIAKYTILAGFGIFVILGSGIRDLRAETYYKYGNAINMPLTTEKCNEFTFDATKSHFPEHPNVSFFWDFGDGRVSNDPIVTHTYQQSGDYAVNLTITDNSGYRCSKASTSETVRVNIPPRASFISKNEFCTNESMLIDASTSQTDTGRPLEYFWNFGDGDIRRGPAQVNKTYTKGGEYIIRLKVDDQSGTPCSNQSAEKKIYINEPPKAEAGNDMIFRCLDNNFATVINFDASLTQDNDNDFLTYIWDFGDGTKEKGVKVSHRYSQTGNYDVKLIVSDGTNYGCGTGVDFVTVKINQAPRAEAGESIVVCARESVKFDGSESFVHKKGTALAKWSFGDGTALSGLYATHRYNHPGTYQATLSLENKLNKSCPISRDTRTIIVNSPPDVTIKSPTMGCTNNEINFDASSTDDSDGDNLLYYWNFGDGTTVEAGPKISHSYYNGGNYRVSVVVDDQKETSCSSVTASVGIRINTPPIADAGPNLSCCVDNEAVFNAGASSDPDGDHLTYSWDFGDGFKRNGQRVIHAFSYAGSYTIRLTVEDNSGSSCSQSTDGFTAVVKDVPIPKIDIY